MEGSLPRLRQAAAEEAITAGSRIHRIVTHHTEDPQSRKLPRLIHVDFTRAGNKPPDRSNFIQRIQSAAPNP